MATAKPEDWRPRFLEKLEEHVTIRAAAKAANVGRSTVYDEISRSQVFAAAVAEVEEAVIQRMEAECFRRAHDGVVEREVRDAEGNLVERTRKYSDSLLMFWLKSKRPGTYRDNVFVDHGGQVDHRHAVALLGEDGGQPLDYDPASRRAAARELMQRNPDPEHGSRNGA